MPKGWKVSSIQPVDEDLRNRVLDKIEEGSFGPKDLREYFTVLTQISNSTEDIQDEVDGFNRTFLIRVKGQPDVWLTIRDMKFEMGSGTVEKPDITLEMGPQIAAEIFSGRTDATAAYMNGDLKVDGVINDAITFRTILELVQDELE